MARRKEERMDMARDRLAAWIARNRPFIELASLAASVGTVLVLSLALKRSLGD